ncbi:MAG TPA: hypothetical protein D7I11_02650 [Candidatus Poseidoniales archaeon]|nr:hypothetical protein [Euryarchaeota archaeon]DAC55676.1 MAG TPA: hypothetical protein D7I11_02650 [Candidatus Poseidoniales archaeon]HII27300.1 hypothetical protein [Poseidonia sp.]
MTHPRTCAVLVALVLLGVWSASITSSLEEEAHVLRSGTADRIVIDNPPSSVSADEVVGFTATIYDPVNNALTGEVSWSVSNGTITDDGQFYPWSAGLVEITAAHNGLTDRYNLSVEPGVPTQIEITRLSVGVLEPTVLTADLLDSRGNRIPGPSTMVWDIDGDYVGQGQPVWTADVLGEVSARVRYNQLEARATLTVSAGVPYAFEFDEPLLVRAGTTQSISPRLVDVNGYAMPLSNVGSLSWFAENGSFNAQGEYLATNTGDWLITVSSGNITGSATLKVIPGDAVASTLMIVDAPEIFMAGESYELVFERRDSNGYIGFVSPPIGALSATSGGLSVDDDLRVYWNPSATGPATVSGTDGLVASSFEVDVVHGRAIDVSLRMEPMTPSAGDQVVIELVAMDIKGNRWVVAGNISMSMGAQEELLSELSYVLVQTQAAQSWRFEGSWFDNSSGTMFVADTSFEVHPGRLAFITLQGEGARVPADGYLDLNPTFFDAYGNALDDVALNWTLDGEDITLEMLLNAGRWTATSVGGHELRVNADGVFATVRLTVVAGTAHGLITDVDEGLIVRAGEPQDLFIQVVDVHGNIAESTSVTTTLNTSLGELEASPTGVGYWQFTGKKVGVYTLVLEDEGSVHTLPLTVEAGAPVRIQASMSRTDISEGEVVLLNAFATDVYGNTLSIPKANTSVSCTAGPVSFVTNGTWEVDVQDGGTDRSCTVRWSGLLAQPFYDVENVLLGGAVGSTNTAMTMAAVLLLLLLAVLITLTRKAAEVSGDEWVEDAFEDEDEDEDGELDGLDVMDNTPLHERHGLTLESMKTLAKEAGKVGVMQATPSTTQGQTGWYVDVSEELQYWEVTPDGEWIRHE